MLPQEEQKAGKEEYVNIKENLKLSWPESSRKRYKKYCYYTAKKLRSKTRNRKKIDEKKQKVDIIETYEDLNKTTWGKQIREDKYEKDEWAKTTRERKVESEDEIDLNFKVFMGLKLLYSF